jgi:hypothetical protein
VAGKNLCIGTNECGILVYDTARDQWSRVSAENGLPQDYVGRLYALGESTLLGMTAGYKLTTVYTLTPATGKIQLRRQGEECGGDLFGVWRAGAKWAGLHEAGLILDALAAKPALLPWPDEALQGWPRGGTWCVLGDPAVAVVAGRCFVKLPDRLVEIDASGWTLRTWPTPYKVQLDYRSTTPTAPWLSRRMLGYPEFPVPGEAPAGTLVGHDGTHLIFATYRRVDDKVWHDLVCYDPRADLWHGPVAVDAHGGGVPHPRTSWVVRRTLWFGWDPTAYVRLDEIHAAAEQAGLVATSEQHRRRWEKRIEGAPPLERAKYALSLRRFDQAKALLEKVLEENPRCAEALILMGFLNDRFFMNQPDVALRYYERVAAMKDDPSAALAGLSLQCGWYAAEGHLQKAIGLGEEMLTRFDLDDECRIGIDAKVQTLRRGAASNAAAEGRTQKAARKKAEPHR